MDPKKLHIPTEDRAQAEAEIVKLPDGKIVFCPIRTKSEMIPNSLGSLQMIEGVQPCKRTCAWFVRDESRDGKVLYEGCAAKKLAVIFDRPLALLEKAAPLLGAP